ncbi:MAG: FAD-dependent oxidoreductase [Clostridia bacterium]|nr:FAD-dependent oxidoreductase [Clostridia bacterium]
MKKIIVILLILSLISLTGCSGGKPELGPDETGVPSADGSKYQLIVVGGEPEGIAAAVSAARNGVKTLLIEDDAALGGLFTLGRLNFLDMNYGPEKELLTRGIFEEFYETLGNAFDVEEAKAYFLNLVRKEKNITLSLETKFLSPLLEGNQVVGIKVSERGEEKEYYAERVIDATTDADVAAAAGVPYTIGAEDYGQKGSLMGVTLVFRVKDVNWPHVFLYNNYSRIISKIKPAWGDSNAGATFKVAWGYGKQALEYQPQDPLMRFRGPNLARQKDSTVLINALLIFGVDSLDESSKLAGIERGKQELPHILEFMQVRFPGFAKVALVDTAEQLYVRETRHIQGEYRLTITDMLENRDHWDRIAHGSYPVDIQPVAPDNLGNVIGKPAVYSIPFRSLVPLKIDNLLVVGRSASYDSLPHGSARVVPVGMATGEAAGAAAAYSLENALGFREMTASGEAIYALQERLKAQGAYLVEYAPSRPTVMDHWAYPGVKVMRELGLAAGGYSNNYRLDETIQYWDADYMLGRVLERIGQLRPEKSFTPVSFAEGLNRGALLSGIARALSGEELTPEEAAAWLEEEGMLKPELKERMNNLGAVPTFGELYMILAGVYETYIA